MTDLKSGFIAGLAATVVLSAMMLIKGAVGAFPELDPIHMIAAMLGAPALVGWIGHFAIGTLAWGGGFALLNVSIPGDKQIVKGILRHRRVVWYDGRYDANGRCRPIRP